MIPGFYVFRRTAKGTMILESRVFAVLDDREWSLQKAMNWKDWIQSEHPKDEVFVFERL